LKLILKQYFMSQIAFQKIFTRFLMLILYSCISIQVKSDITIQFQSNDFRGIDSILVENISRSTSYKLAENLLLTLKTDESFIRNTEFREDNQIIVFPNPVNDFARVHWFSAFTGVVNIAIYNHEGKQVLSQQVHATAGYNGFTLSLRKGIYFLKIYNSHTVSRIKIISLNSENENRVDLNSKTTPEFQKSRGIAEGVEFPYTPGEKLLYKVFSGKMTTIIPDMPTESKTLPVDFYECIDADGNHYPVVVLGKQVWMAENLKTLKFRNAEQIPELQTSVEWAETTKAARTSFHNHLDSTAKYGQLYNYNAIIDRRFLAPEGWRIPTDADFLTLDTFLTNQVYHFNLQEYSNATSVAAAHFLWDISHATATPGQILGKNNSSGFGALPAGYRSASGEFVQRHKTAAFWTMTPWSNTLAWNRKIYHDKSYFSREIDLLQSGFSVRCIRAAKGVTEAPVIFTGTATAITSSSASISNILFSDGGNNIKETGICWSNAPGPRITDHKKANEPGTSLPLILNPLSFNKKYFARAYAITDNTVYYGNEITFTTLPLKVFDLAVLPEIQLEVSTQEWNKLLLYFDQNPHNEEKVVSKFSFTLNDHTTVVEPVGLRLRGNTSRRRPEGSRGMLHNAANPDWNHASFSVDINQYVSGQRFAGLRKVNLKWFKDDSMFAREIYCYDLFRRFGVWTAPQSSYCKLYIRIAEDQKPAYFGIYELLESIDNDFLSNRKQQFGDDKGFLWKAFWGADFKDADANKMGIENVTLTSTYKPVYDLKNRPEELDKAKTELLQFIRDLNQKQGAAFLTWIESKTDVELLLRTYAVSVMCGMWDDYWNNKNNFYFYFNSQGRFFFIPYDYDNTLGTSLLMNDSGRRDLLNWGNNSHPLIYKILQIQKYRTLYINLIHELADEKNDLFHVNRSRPRILQWHKLIKDHIANDTGEDMVIADKPASWGNCGFYRLLETENNFFVTRSSFLPAKN